MAMIESLLKNGQFGLLYVKVFSKPNRSSICEVTSWSYPWGKYILIQWCYVIALTDIFNIYF